MEVTAEMKEALLNDRDAMEILSNMADYRKGLLLELIQSGEIIPHLLKESERYMEKLNSPATQAQMANLPPGGEMEIEYMLKTGIDPDTPLSEWTKAEAKIANDWWRREFPGEPDPLGLHEDLLPDTLEEEDDDDESGRDKWAMDKVCDICRCRITGELYDAQRNDRGMEWATMCADCFKKYGVKLGVGYGQKYVQEADGEFYLAEGMSSAADESASEPGDTEPLNGDAENMNDRGDASGRPGDGGQTMYLDHNHFSIPKDYFKAKALPGDPPNSVVYEKDTQVSTCILMFFFIEKSQAMPFNDDQGIIDCLHNIIGDEQGIIEVKSGDTASGIPFVYTVVKTLKKPSGVQYTLTLQLDFGTYVLNLQGQFGEEGFTGMRDAAVWEYAMREGIISCTDRSRWSTDPYCPDFKKGVPMNLSEQERFDEVFPNHPLSELRRFVQFFVAEN